MQPIRKMLRQTLRQTLSTSLPILLLAACSGEKPEPIQTKVQPLFGDPLMLAVENGTANYTGNVAYGANGSFFYRTMGGPFTCDNATFGDPLVGTVKACFIAPRPNTQIPTKSVANSVADSYSWTSDVQGVAHDDGHWFITQPDTLHKVPLSSNLATDYPAGAPAINLPIQANVLLYYPGGNPNYGSDLNGFNHFGDLDFHSFGNAHALFIPVQGPNKRPVISIFNADTLDYVTSMPLPDLPGVNMNKSGAWVAVQPGPSPNAPVTLWMSIDQDNPSTTITGGDNTTAFISFKFDVHNEIVTPNGDWVNGPTAAISELRSDSNEPSRLSAAHVAMPRDAAGNLISDFSVSQGGAFNEDGTQLYLLSGYCHKFARVHVFQVDASGATTQLKESFNSGEAANAQPAADSNFVFESHPKDMSCNTPSPSWWNIGLAVLTAGVSAGVEYVFGIDSRACYCPLWSQEAEGLDYFDTRGRNVQGVPPSQLHALLLSNGDNEVWFKHFAFPDTPPSGPPDTNLALGQAAYQSSELPGWGPTAWKVADGDTNGDFWHGSVNHTDYGLVNPGQPDWPGQWWYVDLGGLRTVDGINIFNRTDCCSERLSHYNIVAYYQPPGSTVTDWHVVSNHAADDTTGVSFISEDFDVPVQAWAIMIGKTDANYLHLAEVQVIGH